MSDFSLKIPKEQDTLDSSLYMDLARSFLRNNNIRPHPENLFKAKILFKASAGESGQIKISALKLLLDWGGHLHKKTSGGKENIETLSQENALRIICENLKEIGITKEQVEEWM